MPAINISVAYNGRPRVGLPSMRAVNCILEETAAGTSAYMLTTRPGLSLAYTNGTGPILRMNQIPGVFNGDLFSISGPELYRNGSFVGNVPYGQNPRMAAANGQLVIVSGGAVYVYQNNALQIVEFFDDGVSRLPSFSSVAVLYNIFVYTVVGSNQFFFSQVGNAAVINAANFSSAQTSPSPIVEVQVLAEELYFFKGDAVEIWDYTGILTAPFAESQGRTYSRGCAAQGSVVTKVDNSLFWIGDDLSVYRSSNVPILISTPYINDRLSFCGPEGIEQVTAFYLGVEGHALYVLNLPTINESYVYDAYTKKWARWGSEASFQTDPQTYIGGCAAGQTSSNIYVGSYIDGKVYTLDTYIYSDNGKAIKTIFSGAIILNANILRCNNISLQCVRGGGSTTNNPIVEMRFSDDGARTWSSWLQGNLGFAGDYDWKATWRYLGLISSPGRYFEFSVADDVPFTISSCSYNEPRV